MQLQHIVLMCNVQWMEMDILCRGAPGKLRQGEVWLMGSVQIYRGHIHPNLASRVTCHMSHALGWESSSSIIRLVSLKVGKLPGCSR